jgi:hypothetical protein
MKISDARTGNIQFNPVKTTSLNLSPFFVSGVVKKRTKLLEQK